MPNKLPRFFDNHKICIICEGNEEYEYLNRLKNLKVWNEQYDISLVNAGGNGNIPARYQDRYQNGADKLVLVFCDTEKKPHEQYEDIKRKINEFHGVDSAANERLLLRPFPQGKEARVLWQQYREDMISRAGISLYIFGNKKQDDNIVEANGVKTEFDIAIDAKHIVIPVGCTGYMAQKLWEQINLNIEEYYGKVNDEVRKTFQSLNTKMSNDEIVSNIVKLIKLLRR